MENKCDLYTSKDISQFIDGELSSEKYRSLEHHLPTCADCSRLIDGYKTVSIVFSRHADRQSMGNSAALSLKHKLDKSVLNSHEKPFEKISGLFGKNIYLKFACVAAVLMIGLFPFDEDLINDSSGPSAIVNSIDAEYTSVMIIETQEEKHTIIWFSEET